MSAGSEAPSRRRRRCSSSWPASTVTPRTSSRTWPPSHTVSSPSKPSWAIADSTSVSVVASDGAPGRSGVAGSSIPPPYPTGATGKRQNARRRTASAPAAGGLGRHPPAGDVQGRRRVGYCGATGRLGLVPVHDDAVVVGLLGGEGKL